LRLDLLNLETKKLSIVVKSKAKFTFHVITAKTPDWHLLVVFR
jgi:hypothetical protein